MHFFACSILFAYISICCTLIVLSLQLLFFFSYRWFKIKNKKIKRNIKIIKGKLRLECLAPYNNIKCENVGKLCHGKGEKEDGYKRVNAQSKASIKEVGGTGPMPSKLQA